MARAILGWIVAAGALSTCAPGAPEPVAPEAAAEPEVRIGLLVGVPKVRIGAGSGLSLVGAEGDPLDGAPRRSGYTVVPEADGIAVTTDGWRSPPQAAVSFSPTGDSSHLTVNDRPYRGRIAIIRGRSGLTIINRVGLEEYLAGVLSAEMGHRDPPDSEALAAQAVVSRTYAVRNLGKRRLEGFDLYASVTDQVYAGVGGETPLAWQAVRETTGRILTYQGTPIDAFFYSTCGGRTAEGTEVYAGADRPYLRSVPDADENGQPYCRISPRFRWQEEWTRTQLSAILQQTLPAALGTPVSRIDDLRSVMVTRRTPSDRVGRLVIVLGGTAVEVAGPAIRQVLRPSADQLLRSANFTLTQSESGGRLERLTAEGFGSGHGVGFCQWGAVGRARAGQGYQQILLAYFGGTEVTKLY